MNVIEKLNQLRLEKKMSVYRLSELTGITQSTLANAFSRGIVPTIENLEIMCKALGVTMSEFFNEDETVVILSKDEQLMMEKFKKLPPDVKCCISDMIISLEDSIKDLN